MALTERTLRSDLFKYFLTRIKTNLTTPNVKVTNSFVNDEAALPQVVISIPNVQKNRARFGTGTTVYDFEMTIDISIYTKKAQTLSELLDEVQAILYEHCLSEDIRDIQIGSSNDLYFQNEGINVHAQTLPLTIVIGEIQW